MAKTWEEIKREREKNLTNYNNSPRIQDHVGPNWNDIKISRGYQGTPTTVKNEIIRNTQNNHPLKTMDKLSGTNTYNTLQDNIKRHEPVKAPNVNMFKPIETRSTMDLMDHTTGTNLKDTLRDNMKPFEPIKPIEPGERPKMFEGVEYGVPTGEIKPYEPTGSQRLKDAGRSVKEKVDAFAYGLGNAVGARSLSRIFNSDIERNLIRQAEESGNTYHLERYIADREYWDNDKLFNYFLGRNTNESITRGDKIAQGVGSISGNVVKFMTIGQLTGGVSPFKSRTANNIFQRGLTGAIVGAESSYGAGSEAEQVIKDAIKTSGFLAVGGVASDLAGNQLVKLLTPVYHKNPGFSKALQAMVATGRGATMGVAGSGANIALSKMFGEEVDPKEIIQSGITLAAYQGIMSLITRQPFVPSFELNNGPKIKINKEDTAEWLSKNGYKEFKNGSGIWIKRDPTSGAILDQKAEILNMKGVNVYKTDLWKAEKTLGRKLNSKEINDFVRNPNEFIRASRSSDFKPTDIKKDTSPPKQDPSKMYELGRGQGKVIPDKVVEPIIKKTSSFNSPEIQKSLKEAIRKRQEIQKLDIKSDDTKKLIEEARKKRQEIQSTSLEPNKQVLEKKTPIDNTNTRQPIKTPLTKQSDKPISGGKIEESSVVSYMGNEYKIEGEKGENFLAVNVKTGKETFIPKIFEEELNLVGSRPNDLKMEDRFIEDIGNRKIKAYQWNNPQVKPYFTEMAKELLSDLSSTQKGMRYPKLDDEGWIVEYTGQSRITSQTLAEIKDQTNATWDEIKDALNRIIIDEGQENVALAKRIEVFMDENLTNGYTDFSGVEVGPNEEYIKIRNSIEDYKVKTPEKEESFKGQISSDELPIPIDEDEQFTNQLTLPVGEENASLFDIDQQVRKEPETPQPPDTPEEPKSPLWEYEEYSKFSRQLASNYTRKELEKQLNDVVKELEKATDSHLNAIKGSTSMQGKSQARSQARNVVSGLGDKRIALENAIEIYDNYPQNTKESIEAPGPPEAPKVSEPVEETKPASDGYKDYFAIYREGSATSIKVIDALSKEDLRKELMGNGYKVSGIYSIDQVSKFMDGDLGITKKSKIDEEEKREAIVDYVKENNLYSMFETKPKEKVTESQPKVTETGQEVTESKEKVTESGEETIRRVIQEETKKAVEEIKKAAMPEAKKVEYTKLPDRAIDKVDQINNIFMKGLPISVEDLRGYVDYLNENETSFKEELQALTNNELDKRIQSWDRTSYKRKDQKIDKIYTDALTDIYMMISESRSISFGIGGSKSFKQQQLELIENAMKDLDQAKLDKIIENRKVKYEEATRQMEERLERIENPKTLEDYITKKRYKGLSDKETIEYERLYSLDMKQKRLEKQKESVEKSSKLKGEIVASSDKYNINKTQHSKTGEDMWVVSLKERIDKDQWKPFNDSMKELGGYYSRYAKGHIFKTDPTSKLSGETVDIETPEPVENTPENNVENLKKIASSMEKRIRELRNDNRLVNTAKRARQDISAREEASVIEKHMNTVLNIANAIEEGEIEFIDNIRHKTEIDQLNSIIAVARYRYGQSFQSKALKEGKHHWDASNDLNKELSKTTKELKEEIVQYATLPREGFYRNRLQALVNEGLETDGLKQISKSLNKTLASTLDDEITLSNRDFERVKQLANTLKSYDAEIMRGIIKDSNRLEKIGIETEEELRTYLREYIDYVAERTVNKDDEIRKLQAEIRKHKIEGYFPTPKKLVNRMLELANIQDGDRILEPSAGQGHIADQIGIGNVDTVEWDGDNRKVLELKGHKVIGNDALKVMGTYEKIIMNPPFERLQDIDHVMYAYRNNLAPGGRIVAIMSESPFFRGDKKAEEFREFLMEHGYSEKNPEGSFKESDRSTGVNTRMVVIDKPEDEPDPFKGKTPDRDKLSIVHPGSAKHLEDLPPEQKGPVPINEKFKYLDEQSEQDHVENILEKRSVPERIATWAEEFKRMSTRTFRDLDPSDSNNAMAIMELVKYPKFKGMSGDEATRIISDIIDNEHTGLSMEEYNRFERYVFLKDLKQEALEGRELPQTWSEEKVDIELKRLEDSLTENIREAYVKRKKYQNKLKNDYIKAMKDIGFNVENRFNKENYFRHQVLEYQQAKKLAGSGVKTKVRTDRGFLKERQGTDKALNENYIQVEYEVFATMIYDTKVAQMLKRLGDRYDIQKSLKEQAKTNNEKALEDIIRQEINRPLQGENMEQLTHDGTMGYSETEEALTSFRQQIAIGLSKLQGVARSNNLWTDNGKYSYIEDLFYKMNLSGIEIEENNEIYKYLGDLAGQTEELVGQKEARMILKATSQRKKFIKGILGDQYQEWDNIIPEGYKTWQPIEGRSFFMVNAISDKLATALLENTLMEDLSMSDREIRQVMTAGPLRKQYVIPEGLANTLDDVCNTVNKNENAVSKLVSTPMRYWKAWVLTGNPRQVMKYNFRNATGDIDGLMAAAGLKAFNPKYIHEALKEVYDAMKYMKFTPELKEWYDRGGFQSLLYSNEIAEINEMQVFRKYSPEQRASIISKMIPVPKTYFEFTRNFTDYREAILRYASYKYLKKEIAKNGGEPEFYGRSNKAYIKGLPTIEDKAYQISKDAMGSYDDVTETGKAISKYLIPFYRFQETNMKGYYRFAKNVVDNVRTQRATGEKYLRDNGYGGYIPKLGPRIVALIGKLVLRATALTIGLAAWNNTVMYEYEQQLPESVRNSPHIVFGKDKNGNIIYFSRLGVLNDILSWVGLDNITGDIRQIRAGRMDIMEMPKKMAVAPIAKLINSVSPFLKTPAELLSGKSFFPDPLNPGNIRDPYRHIAQSLGVHHLYDQLSGKPMNESYLESWQRAFIYKTNPEVAAYFRIQDLKRKYERTVLNKYPSFFVSEDPKSDALYYYRLSVRYGDEDKAKKYLKEYIELGGTADGIIRSLENLSPIAGLNNNELVGFIEYLNPREREDLRKAMEYYSSLIAPDKK